MIQVSQAAFVMGLRDRKSKAKPRGKSKKHYGTRRGNESKKLMDAVK